MIKRIVLQTVACSHRPCHGFVTVTSRTHGGKPCVRPRCAAHSHGTTHQIVVVGGGAAGLTAAYFAALHGAKVKVLERTKEAGKKILMSGGSRANVLPTEVDLDVDFFSDSPKGALRAVFASWGVWDCWSWLSDPEHLGLPLELEEESQKWFPASNSSRDVRDALVAACKRLGVELTYEASVEDMQPVDGHWHLKLGSGKPLVTERVILATGGLSFPAVGTDGTGHRLVEKVGHKLIKPFPALTPLCGPHPGGSAIAGVSLNVDAAIQTGKKSLRTARRTGFLFTHKGFSGPSILDLSHHAVRALDSNADHPALYINWTNDARSTWEERLRCQSAASRKVVSVLREYLPLRLSEALCAEAGLSDANCSQITKPARHALLESLTRYRLPYNGHQGYKKAEVTGGGVPLTEINCKTMESTVAPGLFLCGEICDVFGRIGGFNFYWAWVSGRMAGLGAAGIDWTSLEA